MACSLSNCNLLKSNDNCGFEKAYRGKKHGQGVRWPENAHTAIKKPHWILSPNPVGH